MKKAKPSKLINLGDEVTFSAYYSDEGVPQDPEDVGNRKELFLTTEQRGLIVGSRSIWPKLIMRKFEGVYHLSASITYKFPEPVYLVATDMRTIRYVPIFAIL